jgi:uncharacterized membrane protein YvbJ
MPDHSFCPNCGFALKNVYKFCPKCGLKSELGQDSDSRSRQVEKMNQSGADLSNGEIAGKLDGYSEALSKSNTSPMKKKSNYLIYIIALIFVFILLIAGNTALFRPGSGGSKDNQEAPSNTDYEICVDVTFNRKIAQGWPVQMALNYSRQVCG